VIFKASIVCLPILLSCVFLLTNLRKRAFIPLTLIVFIVSSGFILWYHFFVHFGIEKMRSDPQLFAAMIQKERNAVFFNAIIFIPFLTYIHSFLKKRKLKFRNQGKT